MTGAQEEKSQGKSNEHALVVVLPLAVVFALAGLVVLLNLWDKFARKVPYGHEAYEVDISDYTAPPVTPLATLLGDDKPSDKKPPVFDPNRVSRELRDGWQFNASAAMFQLDVPLQRPDLDRDELYPSYHAAWQRGNSWNRTWLPSLNLIDGKAKQFDDGLYAAIDQAYYQGLEGKLFSHVKLVEALAKSAGPNSPAAPFLAAGLELAGIEIDVVDKSRKAQWLADFNANTPASKPSGFYTWSDSLKATFRFMRFFQQEFGAGDLEVPSAIAALLKKDDALRSDYQKVLDFYARLTNPLGCRSVLDLIAPPAKKPRRDEVALFPSSDSREVLLFDSLFPAGLPPNADLMREFVTRIRSGKIDLAPRPSSGWYEYQVYALETLLLAGQGEEVNKLVLSASYKKRALEAFQALVTKRRETHLRQLTTSTKMEDAKMERPKTVAPQLRLEPCPTYLIRTARAYAFLETFLVSRLGEDGLASLHGLKASGDRKFDLATELKSQRNLFYGLYLVSCEDLGLAPQFKAQEPVDQKACYQQAIDWLTKLGEDEDLEVDTRVSVPLYVDYNQGKTRLWVTLGVKLVKLDASFVREFPPSIRESQAQPWSKVSSNELEDAHYIIAVDEFAEVELSSAATLSREELRAICDRAKTKEAILEALRKLNR